MCEESACLVPPLEQTQNGQPEPRLSAASGSVHSNGEALVGFHEDALSQAAVGRAQLMLALVLGFGIAADCSELALLGYILPAAELHLCIGEHLKGLLVPTTLIAFTGGSLAWGILGDQLGRRRALVSALSVAALFSAVAAVMPTYGTFLTARFCSGIGVAGAVPIAFSYLAETCPRATRTRYTGLLHSFWPMGALLTSSVAHLILPNNGAETVLDNREHWSSWHRFLILNILPMIVCIIGLLWASESPRYLLEASREVEALAVYQRLHRLNKTRTQYGLTELELPNRSAYRERPSSPSSTRNLLSNVLNVYREAFQRVSSPSHFRTTLTLAVLHLLLGFLYMGISTFSTTMIKDINDENYNAMRKHFDHENYTGHIFNVTLENLEYTNSVFKNVTFTHINFNHVEFVNCVFDEAEFTNVKSSITYFVNTTIKDSRFIDTDLTDHHFVGCNLVNNTFMSLISDCVTDFDYNIYLDDLYMETVAWAGPMLPSLLFIGFVLEATSRPPVIVAMLVLVSLTAIGIFFLAEINSVFIVQAIIKVLLMCAVNTVTMVVLEGYPCHLRCTAHGIMRLLYHIGSLCAIPMYEFLSKTVLLIPAVLTISLSFLGALLSTKIQDNSKVLL